MTARGFELRRPNTAGLFAIALGVWSALHPDSIRARLLGAVTLVGYALPSFVVGLVLVWVFAVKLGLPTGGTSNVLLATDAPAAGIVYNAHELMIVH